MVESATCTPNTNTPLSLGVPEIMPVDDKLIPAGKAEERV